MRLLTKLPTQSLRVVLGLIWLIAAAPSAGAASNDVLTQHNDLARTGAQLAETILTPANVNAKTFGRLVTRAVDGQVIAQPLYVSGLVINGVTRNVVYVVTRSNYVYAFDADNINPNDPANGMLWKAPVLVAATSPVPGMCAETVGPVGVTSTPVIDRATNTMYLTARRADKTIWLMALNIVTGAPVGAGAVQISATYNGLSFNQNLQLQRTAVTLVNGAIVLSFSALSCDNAGWRGWVLAYRASDLAQVGVFATTSAAGFGGGIWQSGNGLAGDNAGNIYFITGNGSVSGKTDLGESFVKLSLGSAPSYGLTYAGSYTASNWDRLNASDADLGASGPVLLPGNRLIGGGKQGKVYMIDAATMLASQFPPTTGAQPSGGSDGFQAFFNTWHTDSTLPICMTIATERACYLTTTSYDKSELYGPNLHTGLVYWNGTIYGMPEKDYLRAFPYNPATGLIGTTPTVGALRSPDGMPGGALSLSANGSTNGIIWALAPKFDGQWDMSPAALVAVDAKTLKELWRDDADVAFSKFTPPTIAGGKVFRPTFGNQFIIYGLGGSNTLPCPDIAGLYSSYGGVNGMLSGPGGAITTLPDGVGRIQTYPGRAPKESTLPNGPGAILWSPTTCAHEVHGAIYEKFVALGGFNFFRYPLSNGTSNGDSFGFRNDFSNQSASIYWSPRTGANEVHGGIRGYWKSKGGIASPFGYPVADEADTVDLKGRFSLFEHGAIYFDIKTAAVTTNVNPAMLVGPQQAGLDRPGGDLAKIILPKANPAICQERCSATAKCVAWTYLAPNSGQGAAPLCYLKSSIPLAVAKASCTSGIVVGVQPANMSAMNGTKDVIGGDLANFSLPTTDPRLCQGECSGNPLCKAWAYGEIGATCWLKSTAPPYSTNYRATAGIKISGP